ncbi:MAG: acylneuraminate cytidylyltransferase family protein [Actinomycetota bacterium]|nr:acylneuraminate cytidylyltransferase family protein [Actinomycetota bacterium]
MSVAGLIPMKGHSERVPGKNLRPIAGKPLFHWIAESLIGAETVDEVIVDTDSDEIEAAVIAAFPSVIVHRRPERLHGDMVPMHDVVAEVARSVVHDHVLQTHATNPLLRSRTVDAAIAAFLEPGPHDSLMSVTSLQTRFYFRDGRPVNHDPAVLVRTQDLDPIYEENSNIYIASRELILTTGQRIGGKPLLFPTPREEAVDIDEELDFMVAEFLLERHG